MLRFMAVTAALAISLTAVAATQPSAPALTARLTAAEIAARSVAARGGLEAWGRIESMAWTGRVEGGSPVPMPFCSR